MQRIQQLNLSLSSRPRTRERILIYLLLSAAYTAFLLVFSSTTSPLTPGYYGGDSAVFQLLGRAWKAGHIPYRDLFDHKGPFIFFLDWLGEMLIPNRTGIFLLQILFGAFTMAGLYETARLRFRPALSAGIALYCLFCLVTWYGDGGNMTEEYCLPFLSWSLYFVVRYGLNPGQPHSPAWAALYGAAFAVCLLTRLTNAICLSVWVLAIILHLIATKRWGNLLQNALAFLGGAAAFVLPFVLYFAANGALSDLWFGMIGANVSVANATRALDQYAYNTVAYLRLTAKFIPLWLVLLGSVYRLMKKQFRLLSLALACSAALFLFYVYYYHTVFLHYQMVNLPLAVAGLILCLPAQAENGDRLVKPVRWLAYALCVAMFAFALNIAIHYEILPGNRAYQESVKSTQAVAAMLDTVPEAERDSIAVYNVPASVMLAAEIIPYYPYSVNLDIQMRFTGVITDRVEQQFASSQARWVLACNVTNANVLQTLTKHYRSVPLPTSVEGYTLYRRIQ